MNRGLAYNSNHLESYNPFIINQEGHVMGILIYENMNEQDKQNPRKRKVSVITVYIPQSDQASIPAEYKIYIIFIILIYLAQRAQNETGLLIKTKYLKDRVWFL